MIKIQTIYFIVIMLIFFSCEQKQVENAASTQATQSSTIVNKADELPTDPVNLRIYLMQAKIDSAAALYDSAIIDFNNGINEKQIRAKYQDRIRTLQAGFAESYEETTQLYMDEEISEAEYERITAGLILDEVQLKSDSLEKAGIFFLE